MPVYLISYDLGVGGDQNYDALIAEIDALGPAVEVNRSTWLVSSALSAEEIASAIETPLCDHDRYFLFNVGTLPGFVMSSRPQANTDAIAQWIDRYVFGLNR